MEVTTWMGDSGSFPGDPVPAGSLSADPPWGGQFRCCEHLTQGPGSAQELPHCLALAASPSGYRGASHQVPTHPGSPRASGAQEPVLSSPPCWLSLRGTATSAPGTRPGLICSTAQMVHHSLASQNCPLLWCLFPSAGKGTGRRHSGRFRANRASYHPNPGHSRAGLV